jgi:hypothetical protein
MLLFVHLFLINFFTSDEILVIVIVLILSDFNRDLLVNSKQRKNL